jgi:hypothetical protein
MYFLSGAGGKRLRALLMKLDTWALLAELTSP